MTEFKSMCRSLDITHFVTTTTTTTIVKTAQEKQTKNLSLNSSFVKVLPLLQAWKTKTNSRAAKTIKPDKGAAKLHLKKSLVGHI
jgi:hypothetical protein